ncbi:hypothetical protein C0585_04300 [Candidatus Woesearchaeota archaeon]|nr:MAG: hypothetical protein C0585_04300 [Candidatus Woesearchaeota archaeon]
MIITISGKAGSGKSTIAKEVAKKLGYTHHSMGDLQRELAKELGVTIEKLGELEKEDRKYDDMIDDKQKQIGKRDNAVVDSRLGALFIPPAFKVFLEVDINEAVKRRISQEKRDEEEFESEEEAKKSMINREKVNRTRFLDLYGFDFLDMKKYNLVIDTTNLDINQIIEKILDKIKDILS